TDDRPGPRARHVALPVVLIALDDGGYANLVRLVSESFLTSGTGAEPQVSIARLAELNAGMVALTGGPSGPLDSEIRLGNVDLAGRRLKRLHEGFADRLYVELQRHGVPAEKVTEPVLVDFAHRHRLPLVATNEPFFAASGDFEAHDALIA